MRRIVQVPCQAVIALLEVLEEDVAGVRGAAESNLTRIAGFTQLADHQLNGLSSSGSGPELPRTWSCLEQEAGGHWDGEGGWAEEVRTSGEKDR